MTLSHVELAESANSFCVLSCGPNWGLSPIVADSDRPEFNWQVDRLNLRLVSIDNFNEK